MRRCCPVGAHILPSQGTSLLVRPCGCVAARGLPRLAGAPGRGRGGRSCARVDRVGPGAEGTGGVGQEGRVGQRALHRESVALALSTPGRLTANPVLARIIPAWRGALAPIQHQSPRFGIGDAGPDGALGDEGKAAFKRADAAEREPRTLTTQSLRREVAATKSIPARAGAQAPGQRCEGRVGCRRALEA